MYIINRHVEQWFSLINITIGIRYLLWSLRDLKDSYQAFYSCRSTDFQEYVMQYMTLEAETKT